MRKEYEKPEWANKWDKFYAAFCRSSQALFEIVWNIGGSIVIGSGFIASKIFSITGNALDPVIAANLFIIAASAVVLWGLYSWVWVGITLGSFLGIPTGIAGILGFIVGVLLNISEVLPDVGQLFQEYADVLGRAGKEAEARRWDESGINAQNFLGYSYARLKFFRNVSFIAELTSSALYQLVIGGFTKTVVVKGVTIVKALPFWPMMGSIAWCFTLVKAPECAIKAAAAAGRGAADAGQLLLPPLVGLLEVDARTQEES